MTGDPLYLPTSLRRLYERLSQALKELTKHKMQPKSQDSEEAISV